MKKLTLNFDEDSFNERFPFFTERTDLVHYLVIDLAVGEAYIEERYSYAISPNEFNGQLLALTIDDHIRRDHLLDVIDKLRDDLNYVLALVNDVEFNFYGEPDRDIPLEAIQKMNELKNKGIYVEGTACPICCFDDLNCNIDDLKAEDFKGFVDKVGQEIDEDDIVDGMTIEDLIIDEIESMLADLDKNDEAELVTIKEYEKVIADYR